MPDSIVPIISTAGRSGAFKHIKKTPVPTSATKIQSNLAMKATKGFKGGDRGPTKSKK